MRLHFKLTIMLCAFFAIGLSAQVIDAAPPPPPPPPPAPDLEEQGIFRVVEEMPRFPGCEDIKERQARKDCAQEKLINYIYENLDYPEIAKANGVEGMAVISFTVEKNGELSNIRIVRDPGAMLGQTAANTVQKMNTDGIRWIPGKQRGQAVKVQFNLPVRFKLPEAESVEEPVIAPELVEEEVAMEAVEEAPPPPPVRVVQEESRPRTAAEKPAHQQPVEIPADALDPSNKNPSRMAPPPPPPPPPPPAREVFKVVEDMPRYLQEDCEAKATKDDKKECAQQAMLNFVYSNLQYPAIARDNKVEGICVLSFVVEIDGSLSDIKILRDIGAQCGQEAKRVIGLMATPGTWTPGKQRGRPVPVQYNLPVNFKIED